MTNLITVAASFVGEVPWSLITTSVEVSSVDTPVAGPWKLLQDVVKIHVEDILVDSIVKLVHLLGPVRGNVWHGLTPHSRQGTADNTLNTPPALCAVAALGEIQRYGG